MVVRSVWRTECHSERSEKSVPVRGEILRSLLVKLIKIGAKVVKSGRYTTFQMAEVAISRDVVSEILARISRLRC